MYVRREDMHICVYSLLKCKMHLHLHDFVGEYLHYATVEFKVHIYICIAVLKIALHKLICVSKNDVMPCR
jgi:hypothetical protein